MSSELSCMLHDTRPSIQTQNPLSSDYHMLKPDSQLTILVMILSTVHAVVMQNWTSGIVQCILSRILLFRIVDKLV